VREWQRSWSAGGGSSSISSSSSWGVGCVRELAGGAHSFLQCLKNMGSEAGGNATWMALSPACEQECVQLAWLHGLSDRLRQGLPFCTILLLLSCSYAQTRRQPSSCPRLHSMQVEKRAASCPDDATLGEEWA